MSCNVKCGNGYNIIHKGVNIRVYNNKNTTLDFNLTFCQTSVDAEVNYGRQLDQSLKYYTPQIQGNFKLN